jgi:hypothetical protein
MLTAIFPHVLETTGLPSRTGTAKWLLVAPPW